RYTGRSCRRSAGVARRQRPTSNQKAQANSTTATDVQAAVAATCAAWLCVTRTRLSGHASGLHGFVRAGNIASNSGAKKADVYAAATIARPNPLISLPLGYASSR